ncbi:hypothetical protein FRC03_002831 [Tulasnella sp. 419]|nr:hypothetical protein FRC02_003189 [Tulasnella sp. 418]KAG8963576.1 hypothetical protein FRC03_002831 [Tulasnella sp. 419]
MSRKSQSLTIVIKLGTSSIVHETTHQPLLSLLSGIVETVIRLKSQGHRVVLVSSGAIGVGLKRMNMAERPKHLAGKQALAAVGQGRLIALWDNLFSQLEQPIAQILLTRGDISDRSRYLNAVNTLTELLNMGVVPIVNENDTVSVSEIKFGDNDTLSAITSSMLHADYLFLLTDVECLYTSNPRKDPEARPIEVVTSVPIIRQQVSTATLGSKLGTGGMETKLIAAEIATGAGVGVVITSSKKPEVIFDIIQYDLSSAVSYSPTPSSNTPLSSIHKGISTTPAATGTNTPIRPPHTLFKPSATPLRDLKLWTSHTLTPSGSVVIDAGAHHVLARRESGGRLLPVGVLGVIGTFASGQAVRICVMKGPQVASTKVVAAAVKVETLNMNIQNTEEDAQTIESSNLSSLGPQTNDIISEKVSEIAIALVDDDASKLITTQSTAYSKDTSLDEREITEVGRGLANYNSAEILKLRGVKSSQIQQILGYGDSEHVVENITIRVPPM